MREATVEHRLTVLARRHGGKSYKWTSPGVRGVPDRIIVLPGGRIYFVEVKRPGGKARPEQLVQIEALRNLGCQAYVVDDADQFFEHIVDAHA